MLHKKAPSTLVDDCIDKFRQHEVERKRLRLLNGQRGSTESGPVEFLIGSDPLSAALNECKEEAGSPGAEETSGGGGGGKSVVFITPTPPLCAQSGSNPRV